MRLVVQEARRSMRVREIEDAGLKFVVTVARGETAGLAPSSAPLLALGLLYHITKDNPLRWWFGIFTPPKS